MFYRSRLLLVIALVAISSAAYAALRWNTWTPTGACLLCEASPGGGAPAVSGSGAAAIGTGGALSVNPHDATGTSAPGALTAPGSAGLTAENVPPSSARFGGAPRGWQPWSASTGTFRVSASGSSGPSAPLGGLWRLMSLSRPGHTAAPEVAGSRVDTPAAHTSAPVAGHTATPGGHTSKAPAPPASSPSSTSTSAAPVSAAAPSTGTGGTFTVTAPSDGAPPTDPFHSHEDPPPTFGGGSSGGGSFDPGGGSAGVPSSGGGVSATPEPGSVLLIGTGLIGILGILRRRRLI